MTIKDGQVVEIDWHFNLKGSLQLEWLPSSVGGFVVGWNFDITGTLNSASFWKHIGGWYHSSDANRDVDSTAKNTCTE